MKNVAHTDPADSVSKTAAEDLFVEHAGLCATANFLKSQYSAHYSTLDEFLAEYEADTDQFNLCFRWDIERKEAGEGYRLLIFTVQQRKGLFFPIVIDQIKEEECERLAAYLQRHWRLLTEMWLPISARPQLSARG